MVVNRLTRWGYDRNVIVQSCRGGAVGEHDPGHRVLQAASGLGPADAPTQLPGKGMADERRRAGNQWAQQRHFSDEVNGGTRSNRYSRRNGVASPVRARLRQRDPHRPSGWVADSAPRSTRGRALAEPSPPLVRRGISWNISSLSIVDTAGSGLLNIWYGDPNGPEAAAHSHAPVKPFSELGLVGDCLGWRRSRDDRSSPGTRTGARALRLDGTPGQMDRPGLSPQRRLHPGAVDAVSGLPHRKGAPRRPCTHRTGCGRRRERARYHRHQPRVPDL